MGQLRPDGQPSVECTGLVGREAYGDGAVGVGGDVFTRERHAVALETVGGHGLIDVERALVVLHLPLVPVVEMEGGQGLVVLRVVSLHVELQAVGTRIVLGEESLANLGNPLRRPFPLVGVYGLPRPQRDVVQIDEAVVCAAVHQCAHLTVADGQRLFKIARLPVVDEPHGQLPVGVVGLRHTCTY